MAKIVYFFLLAISISCACSARILDEFDLQQPSLVPANPTGAGLGVAPGVTAATLPSGQIPATADDDDVADPPIVDDGPAPVAAPVDDDEDDSAAGTNPSATVAPVTGPTTALPTGTAGTNPSASVAPLTGPTTALPTAAGTIPITASATSGNSGTELQGEATLTFFMHDIVGGSQPSSRTVTGVIASTETNGIPFSKNSNNFFPLTGGTPLLNNNLNNIVNTQNLPFLTGLNGAQPTTILQNSGNNNNIANGNNNNQAFVTAGQLPAGASLQKLMFGSITVFDDELTEGHELGSAVVGSAQGFYLASSLDGTSQTIALTVLLHGGEHEVVEDTISFFGVHRTASPESQVAVVGGTGKYENAKGFATLEAMHLEDQHITDGIDTILQFGVYLTV
jgi:hypothetical protein